jgi:hypothetical protein
MANRELQVVIFPKIMSLRENYFLSQKDYTLGTSRRFRLPSRIMGDRVSQVLVINGSESYSLPQTSINVVQQTGPSGFFVG